jgi:hypothetical protein
MNAYGRKGIEAKLRRMTGPTAEEVRKINAAFFASGDLHVICKRCGKKRVGTMEQLNKPCGCDEENP